MLKLIKQAGEKVTVYYERPVGSVAQDSFAMLEDSLFPEEDAGSTSTESDLKELDLEFEDLANDLRSNEPRDESSTISPKHISVSAATKSIGSISPILNRKLQIGGSTARAIFKEATKQVGSKNAENPEQTNKQPQASTSKPPVPPRPHLKTSQPNEVQNTLETGDLISEKPERPPPPPASNGDKSSEKITKNADVQEEPSGAKLVVNKSELIKEPSEHSQVSKENIENHHSWESPEILFRNRSSKWARTKGSSYVFEVEKHHQYLNVAVWCRDPFKVGGLLCLGYESIKLEEIALDCIATASREFFRTFRLNPPAPKATVSRTALRTLTSHKGFNEKFCYGDITIHFKYLREGEPEDSSFLLEKEREYSSEEVATPILPKEDPYLGHIIYTENKHNFQDTQFQNPTWCDYCKKKVWTKAASQCVICAYVCHKKCQEKCLTDTPFCLGASRRLDKVLRSFKLESQDSQSTGIPRADSELKSANKTGLTRHLINTSTRLLNLRQAPKYRANEQGSEAAEPSPKPTPHGSDNEGSDTEMGGSSSPTKRAGRRGIKLARKEGGLDDSVFIAVKEIGRDLYRSLPTEERIQKLEVMLEKLQNEIDQELENNNSLIKEEKEATDARKKSLLSAALAKSGERLQALTLLMIHYRAGIEDIEALENTGLDLESTKEEKYDEEKYEEPEDESALVMTPILETLLNVEDEERPYTPQEPVA